MYHQISNISRSLVENKLAYRSLYLWVSFPKITKKNTPLVLPLRARYMGVFLWVHIWPNVCVQYRVIFDCNMSRVYSEMMMMMMTVIMTVIMVIWKVRINPIITLEFQITAHACLFILVFLPVYSHSIWVYSLNRICVWCQPTPF